MPIKLSHKDCLDLVANPSTQNILEKLGFEYSDRGLSEYRKARPNFVPSIIQTIVTELELHSIFPAKYKNHIPETGVYIRIQGDDFVVMEIDKPSVWQEDVFSTPEGSAQSYLRRVMDSYRLNADPANDAPPKSVYFGWKDPPGKRG